MPLLDLPSPVLQRVFEHIPFEIPHVSPTPPHEVAYSEPPILQTCSHLRKICRPRFDELGLLCCVVDEVYGIVDHTPGLTPRQFIAWADENIECLLSTRFRTLNVCLVLGTVFTVQCSYTDPFLQLAEFFQRRRDGRINISVKCNYTAHSFKLQASQLVAFELALSARAWPRLYLMRPIVDLLQEMLRIHALACDETRYLPHGAIPASTSQAQWQDAMETWRAVREGHFYRLYDGSTHELRPDEWQRRELPWSAIQQAQGILDTTVVAVYSTGSLRNRLEVKEGEVERLEEENYRIRHEYQEDIYQLRQLEDLQKTQEAARPLALPPPYGSLDDQAESTELQLFHDEGPCEVALWERQTRSTLNADLRNIIYKFARDRVSKRFDAAALDTQYLIDLMSILAAQTSTALAFFDKAADVLVAQSPKEIFRDKSPAAFHDSHLVRTRIIDTMIHGTRLCVAASQSRPLQLCWSERQKALFLQDLVRIDDNVTKALRGCQSLVSREKQPVLPQWLEYRLQMQPMSCAIMHHLPPPNFLDFRFLQRSLLLLDEHIAYERRVLFSNPLTDEH